METAAAMTVLDASAVLAFLRHERGGERVAAALPGGVLSTVNLVEVLGKETRDGLAPEELLETLLSSDLTIVGLSVKEALLAAELLPLTKRRGLSLGDRACLATAISRGAPVLTADRAWEGLDVGVPVEVIR